MNKGRKKRAVYDEEIARTVEILKRMPIEILREISGTQIVRAYDIRLARTTVDPIKAEVLEARKKEKRDETTGQEGDAAGLELGSRVVLERIARIHAKTEPVLGAGELLSERDAVVMTIRELKTFDSTIVSRNVKRAVPKTRPATADGGPSQDRKQETSREI